VAQSVSSNEEMKQEDLPFLSIMGKNKNDNSNSKKRKNQKTQTNSSTSKNDTRKKSKVLKLEDTQSTLSSSATNMIDRNFDPSNVKVENHQSRHHSKKQRNKAYATPLFVGLFIFIILMNRIAFSLFCDYDESLDLYIIQDDTIPTTSTARSHSICQSSHLILDYIALSIYPIVDYDLLLPKTKKIPSNVLLNGQGIETNDENDSEIAVIESTVNKSRALVTLHKNPKKRGVLHHSTKIIFKNPINVVFKFCKSIMQKITNFIKVNNDDVSTNQKDKTNNHENTGRGRSSNSRNDSPKIDTDSNKDEDSKAAKTDENDLTMYVSFPLKVELTPLQEDIIKKTGHNFLNKLNKKTGGGDNDVKNDLVTNHSTLSEMFWGGKGDNGRFASFPWWFPPGTTIEPNSKKSIDETSGSSLMYSYLRIMDWPMVCIQQSCCTIFFCYIHLWCLIIIIFIFCRI
jgi:hypothetical protein